MHTKARRRLGLLPVLLVAGLLTGITVGSADAQSTSALQCMTPSAGLEGSGAVTYDLTADDDYVQFPDGNVMYMWSYHGDGSGWRFPGPTLCPHQGDVVTVNLTNSLAVPTSIYFPGQTGVTSSGGGPGILADEAAVAGTVSYTFTASEPGTYIYESGTEQAKQVQMGLFGGLVIRPGLGAQYAYNDADTEFDTNREYLLLFHEIDPVIHQAIETDPTAAYDPTLRHNRYWTINGRSFPDTIAPNNAPFLPKQPDGALVHVKANAIQPALVRYGNAGLDNHPFHPHGDHLTLVGEDGRMYPGEIDAFTKTVASGQTFDLLAAWDDVEPWNGSGNPTPVAIPGLENLVFKDGVSLYSGDPDLGETATLPSGVTSFTVCGEYYFPWHSHALQEIQNFDEGFGGMLTLWRVDPPAGVTCQ